MERRIFMSTNTIGVIAASPFDTQMGVERLKEKDCLGIPCPATKGGDAFTAFSLLPIGDRNAHVEALCKELVEKGATAIMIYCNALSSLLDIDAIQKNVPVRIVTPFMVYREYALQYDTLSVICGTNQGLGGIEQAIRGARQSDYVIGAGCLKIVRLIEKNLPPKEIFLTLGIPDLLKFFEKCGSQCLILGCTHLPYAYETFRSYSNVPVLDPFESMYVKLTS